MPSYTETFPCPVCCGTTTTTVGPSTTNPPYGTCPPGYEPCEGENLWNWFVPPNIGEGSGTTITPECYWEELIACSEGCESYPPDFTPLCEAGQEIAAPGLCCRPTTSTTESPSTSTTCAPGQTIGFRLQDIFNEFSSTCKICVAVQCGSSEPNIFYTCEECESQANVFNSAQPFCNLYECSPAPPL